RHDAYARPGIRDVYTHLFESTAAHKAHDAAAAGGTVIVLSFPAGALEAAGRSPAQALEVLALEFVFDGLEFGADAVAKLFEPGGRPCFAWFHSRSLCHDIFPDGNN